MELNPPPPSPLLVFPPLVCYPTGMSISRSQAQTVGTELTAAVTAVFEKHGMSVGKTSTRFGEYITFKVEGSLVSEGANGVNTATPEAQAWVRHRAWDYTFENPEEALGAVVLVGGREMVFAGFNVRARKMPMMLTEVATGKKYKHAEAGVEEQLPGYTKRNVSTDGVGVPYRPV